MLKKRLKRLGSHFKKGVDNREPILIQSLKGYGQRAWWLMLLFLVLDIIYLPDLYELLTRLKPGHRKLTKEELRLAKKVFGESIDYNKVRIDEQASIACRKYRLAYVGFNTINVWGRITPRLLMHELMHVWQYQQIGSIYVPLALLAQRSKEGYNYGGHQALKNKIKLADFNLEQQASIVEDYFCLLIGIKPQFCADKKDEKLSYFQALIEEIKGSIKV